MSCISPEPLREYATTAGRAMWWWIISVLGAIAGFATDFFGFDITDWQRRLLWTGIVAGLVIVPFIAFKNIRNQRDALRLRLEPICPFSVSVAKPLTFMSKANEELELFGGNQVYSLWGVTVRNDGATTTRNVRLKLESIEPTEGIPTPVSIGIGLNAAEKNERTLSFDIAPKESEIIYVIAFPKLGRVARTCVLLLNTDGPRSNIPITHSHKLTLGVFGDDVAPYHFALTLGDSEQGLEIARDG